MAHFQQNEEPQAKEKIIAQYKIHDEMKELIILETTYRHQDKAIIIVANIKVGARNTTAGCEARLRYSLVI